MNRTGLAFSIALVSAVCLLLVCGPRVRHPEPTGTPASPRRPAPSHQADAIATPSTPAPTESPDTMPRLSLPPDACVRFNRHRYAHATDITEALEQLLARLDRETHVLALLGIAATPGPRLRRALEADGTTLLSYIPDYGWLARVHGSGIRCWQSHLTIVHELDAGARLDPDLFRPTTCDTLPVYVHLWPGADGQGLLRLLRHAGLNGLRLCAAGGIRYAAGQVPTPHLWAFRDLVGGHPDVTYVERGAGARLLNNHSAPILQSGSYTGPTPFWDAGVYGTNQVIAVLDTGLDVDSGFFRDASGVLPPANRIDGTNVNLALRKVIAADFLYPGDNPTIPTHWDNQGHGTHVSGHALGSLISDPFGTTAYNGMAPAAKLIAQDGGFTTWDNCADLVGLGCPVTNFYPALQQAVAQGATIHNNSWGDRENFTPHNTYTEPCRELDLTTWSNKEFLVVCAAGNDGKTDTVSSPSTAKNALSVAACNPASGQESLASFSSRGWADDGRLKPDVTAPGGFNVYSSASDGDITTDNANTRGGGGTSYSSPMAAGMAALVRDYFQRGYHPTGHPEPTNAMASVSAALVKAVLINGCVAMAGASAPPPARDQGWGRIDLSSVLPLTNATHDLLVEDDAAPFASSADAAYTLYLDVTGTGTPLKVTLVWSDYPAAAGAGKQLVNDLDLRMRGPGWEVRGNVFSGGWSIQGGKPDRNNNVEQILFVPPGTGLVEITVSPHIIPEPAQDFALVVRGRFGTWSTDRDDDGDGLPDAWELRSFGDLSGVATDDVDGDGVDSCGELVAGTDPNDAGDRLAIVAVSPLTPHSMILQWPGVSGRLYGVQSRTDLVAGAWGPVTDGLPATVPLNTVTVRSDGVENEFYRIRVRTRE